MSVEMINMVSCLELLPRLGLTILICSVVATVLIIVNSKFNK